MTLASPFFASCPNNASNPTTGFAPFPALNVTAANYTIGGPISITYSGASAASGTLYCAFASGLTTGVRSCHSLVLFWLAILTVGLFLVLYLQRAERILHHPRRRKRH